MGSAFSLALMGAEFMWAFRVLGFVAAILSLVMLTKLGLALRSFAAPLQISITYYDAWVHFFLGWAEPGLRALTIKVGARVGWTFDLYPQWKHVFVLMWLYFGADTRIYWLRGKRLFAVITLVWGGITALISSVASGAQPFSSPNPSLLVAAFPVAGVIIYELGIILWKLIFFSGQQQDTRETILSGTLSFVIPSAVIGLVALLWLPNVLVAVSRSSVGVGLAILFVFVLSLALFRLARGVWTASFDRTIDETWLNRFKRSSSTRIGSLMLSTMGGAACFIAANAGLKLIGF